MRNPRNPALLRAFAAELKARRATLGLNQEGLAFAAGIDRTFVVRLETCSTSPSLDSLFRIGTGLEIDPAELIGSVAKRYRNDMIDYALMMQGKLMSIPDDEETVLQAVDI